MTTKFKDLNRSPSKTPFPTPATPSSLIPHPIKFNIKSTHSIKPTQIPNPRFPEIKNPNPKNPQMGRESEHGYGHENNTEDDQTASMREAFALFDTDGDGRIAASDLGIVMRSLGSNPTQAQLRAIEHRENLTAPFDFDRFLDLMAKYMKPDDPFESELRDAFRVLDKDSSGYVSVSDLRHILTSIGEKLEPGEFDEWIQEVDVGPDGRFQYEEFISQLLVK